MLVSSSDRKGQDTAEPCPWRGRLRIGLITQHSPGQGGEVPPAQLLELGVPKSLRDAEASGKALSWRSSCSICPGRAGASRCPGCQALISSPQSPLAGQQPVLEALGSGGRRSHCGAASPARPCPRVLRCRSGYGRPTKPHHALFSWRYGLRSWAQAVNQPRDEQDVSESEPAGTWLQECFI